MKIVFFLYDGMTALDAVGPYEVLACMSDAEVVFVAEEAGPVMTDTGSLLLVAEKSIAEIDSADILLIPGGPGDEAVMANEAVLDWVRRIDQTSTYTTSVCTGALILGAAGLLKGQNATTYWARLDWLERFGVNPKKKRFVRSGKYWTAAGVSAGIDMALALLAEIKGASGARAVRIGIEYFPKAPVWAPSPWLIPASWRKKLAVQAESFMKKRMDRRGEQRKVG